jgi:hypothetical protein
MSDLPTVTQGEPASDAAPSGRPQFDPWDRNYEVDYINDTSNTWVKWRVAQRIAAEREVIEADPLAALAAIADLVRHEVQPPKWIVDAFWPAWSRFRSLEALSLDVAFGHKPPSPRRAKATQRDAVLLRAVSDAVMCTARADPSKAQMVLFEEAVVLLKARHDIDIGQTKLGELYRLGVKVYGLPDVEKLKAALMVKPDLLQAPSRLGR